MTKAVLCLIVMVNYEKMLGKFIIKNIRRENKCKKVSGRSRLTYINQGKKENGDCLPKKSSLLGGV